MQQEAIARQYPGPLRRPSTLPPSGQGLCLRTGQVSILSIRNASYTSAFDMPLDDIGVRHGAVNHHVNSSSHRGPVLSDHQEGQRQVEYLGVPMLLVREAWK